MKVIIEYGKHGDRVLDASTPEAWAASAVEILRERMEYYIWEPEPWEKSYEYRRLHPGSLPTDEEMANMPEDFQAGVRAKRKEIEKARIKYEAGVREYNEMKRIVDENDTSMKTLGRGKYERQEPLAWRYVQDRNGHEYERVELMDVWHAEA